MVKVESFMLHIFTTKKKERKEEIGYYFVLQNGWNLKIPYKVKEACHKRPYIIWFDLYEMSRRDKSINTETRLMISSGWKEAGMGSDC